MVLIILRLVYWYFFLTCTEKGRVQQKKIISKKVESLDVDSGESSLFQPSFKKVLVVGILGGAGYLYWKPKKKSEESKGFNWWGIGSGLYLISEILDYWLPEFAKTWNPWTWFKKLCGFANRNLFHWCYFKAIPVAPTTTSVAPVTIPVAPDTIPVAPDTVPVAPDTTSDDNGVPDSQEAARPRLEAVENSLASVGSNEAIQLESAATSQFYSEATANFNDAALAQQNAASRAAARGRTVECCLGSVGSHESVRLEVVSATRTHSNAATALEQRAAAGLARQRAIGQATARCLDTICADESTRLESVTASKVHSDATEAVTREQATEKCLGVAEFEESLRLENDAALKAHSDIRLRFDACKSADTLERMRLEAANAKLAVKDAKRHCEPSWVMRCPPSCGRGKARYRDINRDDICGMYFRPDLPEVATATSFVKTTGPFQERCGRKPKAEADVIDGRPRCKECFRQFICWLNDLGSVGIQALRDGYCEKHGYKKCPRDKKNCKWRNATDDEKQSYNGIRLERTLKGKSYTYTLNDNYQKGKNFFNAKNRRWIRTMSYTDPKGTIKSKSLGWTRDHFFDDFNDISLKGTI